MVPPKFKPGDTVVLPRGGGQATRHTVVKVIRSKHRKWFCLLTDRILPASQNSLLSMEEAVAKRLSTDKFRMIDPEEELRQEQAKLQKAGAMDLLADFLNRLSRMSGEP